MGIPIDNIKQSLDLLYENKNTSLISLTEPLNMALEEVKLLTGLLYDTETYPEVVDIILKYPDQEYKANTIGEFMFGCVSNEDKLSGCLPICNNSILPKGDSYTECDIKVWKLSNGKLTAVNNKSVKDKRAVLLLSDGEVLSKTDEGTIINSGVDQLVIYNAATSDYVKTVNFNHPDKMNTLLITDDRANGQLPVESGKGKGKDATNGTNGTNGGKKSTFTWIVMVVVGVLIIAAVWWFFKDKLGKGSVGGHKGAPAPVQPQYHRDIDVDVYRYGRPDQLADELVFKQKMDNVDEIFSNRRF